MNRSSSVLPSLEWIACSNQKPREVGKGVRLGCGILTGSLCSRWIERFNRKLREAGKKEEVRRLKEFVETAFKKDPRVIQHRAEEKAER